MRRGDFDFHLGVGDSLDCGLTRRHGGEQPCVVARKRYGRIAVANADAGAYSYTDAAIDQGYRAIRELLGG